MCTGGSERRGHLWNWENWEGGLVKGIGWEE